MATVVSPVIEPEPQAIKAHLEALFAPARETYPRGLIELRYGRDGSLSQIAYFNLREEGVAQAAAFAANRNREGANVYVGVNPRKPSTDTSRASSAHDVEIAFWHFADLDKADAVANAGKRIRALPPTMTVNTGTVPHRRPHLYWQLEEPVSNMEAWTERQRGIAQTLEGDSVIDPPRIMRLAGTVNFPTQKKLQAGYQTERTSLKQSFDEERAPVSPDEVSRAFPVRDIPYNPQGLAEGQNTLQAMRRTRVQDLLDACLAGNEWHNNMVRLVAHLAAIGRTTAEILALADHITLPGFTVDQTRREMAKALDGARVKWALPEPDDAPVEAEERLREAADAIFDLLDIDELESMPPPTWLIHELIAEEGLTVIYGDPGAGKSFVALDMALRVSHAMDWHGTEARATGVLYIAGEGVRGMGKRIKGWKRQHDMQGVDAPFLLLPVAVQLLDTKERTKLIRTIDAAVERAGFAIGLVVIDTVSRAMAGAEENSQDAMSNFVAACDEIRRHAGGALLAVHHSGKDKEKGMRGSTVLLGGCDASIRLTKSDKIVTLKTEKQKDAEEAAPIYMEMRKVEWADTGLSEEQSTLVPFRSEATAQERLEKEDLREEQIIKIMGILADAWVAGKPLSTATQTRKDGRYAPRVLARAVGCREELVSEYLADWFENGCLEVDVANSRTKARGIKVVDPIYRGKDA